MFGKTIIVARRPLGAAAMALLGSCASNGSSVSHDICPAQTAAAVIGGSFDEMMKECDKGNILLCNPGAAAMIGLIGVFAAPVYFVPRPGCKHDVDHKPEKSPSEQPVTMRPAR